MSMPPHYMSSMTLKALLEDPNLKNPPIINQSSNNIKVKKEDGNSDTPQFDYGSAFLGPNLWDKTYATSDFNLEYMDLDEFLTENELPETVRPETLTEQPKSPLVSTDGPPLVLNTSVTASPPSPRQFLNTPPMMSPNPTFIKTVPSSPIYSPPTQSQNAPKSPSPPVSPFHVDFQVTEQDLELTSVPEYDCEYSSLEQAWRHNGSARPRNGNNFDPRKRNFTDEELKPQPIIKKSKKIFVPEDLKDDKYWARRHKNNFAAKRSRDARRVKENQIALRAAFLEKENKCLRDEMMKLRKENSKLSAKVAKYEEEEDPAILSLTAP